MTMVTGESQPWRPILGSDTDPFYNFLDFNLCILFIGQNHRNTFFSLVLSNLLSLILILFTTFLLFILYF